MLLTNVCCSVWSRNVTTLPTMEVKKKKIRVSLFTKKHLKFWFILAIFFFLTISKELYSLMRSCTVEPGTTDFGSSATLSIPPLWKIVWKFLKKLKVELPCDPAVPFLGIHLEKMKILNLQRYVHPSIHSNTVYSN